MKKIFTYSKAITLLLTLLFSIAAEAQTKISCPLIVNPFSRTYTYLATGTAVDDIETDEATKSIPIGFTFKIGPCGAQKSATNIQVSSNGWAKLLTAGRTATTGGAPNSSSTIGYTVWPGFGVWWGNLSGVGGEASYETELLPSGLKVFTMEWKNWKWDPTATAASVSFQLKLYEGSNIVEYCYKIEAGSIAGAASVATVAYIDGQTPARSVATCYDFVIFTGVGAIPVVNRTGAWGPGLGAYPPDNQVYQFYQSCCGKPTAGIITQPDSVCPGAPFVAKASGATPNPFSTYGVQYQWQAAPTATGPWTTITGATITSLSFPGIYNDTFLRMIVQCDSAKPVPMYDTTPVKHITLITQSFNCYCYSGASNDILNVNIGNLKLIAAGKDTLINNGNGLPSFINKGIYRPYTLFTGLSPIREINRDTTYDFSVMGVTRDTFAFSTSGVALYIDYNADGIYNATTELAAFKVISGTSASFVTSFTVPPTATLDTVGMRVVMKKGAATAMDVPPCGAYNDGETEDYLLIISNPRCPGPLLPGTTYISDTSMCDGYAATIWNVGHATNMSKMHWEWEYSLDNVIWANVPMSKFVDTIEPIVRQSTYYRLRMVCENTLDTIYSNKVYIKLKQPYKCYCYSISKGGALGDSSDITTFIIGTFVANSGGPHLKNPGANRRRTDRTDLPAIELYSQDKYPIAVYHTLKGATHANAKISVFMDYNHNLQYDGASELAWSRVTTATDFYPHDTITIPFAIIPNVETGMRIVLNNDLGTSNPNSFGCDEFESGEIEDYLVIFRKRSTGIGEVTNVDNLQIYPNPNNGAFTISFNPTQSIKEAKVIVTNMTGQQVFAEQYTNISSQFNKSISLGNQASGVYFITLVADGQKSVNKLIVR
ncbi:MAG: T9SS type A sorting domain-containing protein [Chitinophagaceae bacterium]|nr:T9SS type A sorting domain-containing protein [Chitinophagaceae bacterium]